MIQVDNAFRVRASPKDVFAALSNVETVVECLPGTRVMGAVDARNVLVQARVPFGRVSISYRGSLHVTGDDSVRQRISFRVRGREMRGEGTIEAIVDVLLHADGDQTDVTVKADATITGKAAILRAGVVEAAARTLLTRFGEALSEHVRLHEPEPLTHAQGPADRGDVELMGKVGGEDESEETTMAGETVKHQDRDAGPGEEPRVAGEVRLMTEEPVVLGGDPEAETLVLRLMQQLDKRPWLAPVSLLSLLAVVLLLRRRNR